MDENALGKKIPGLLGQGVELRKLKVRSKKEFELLMKLKALPEIKETIPQLKKIKYPDINQIKKSKEEKDLFLESSIQIKPVCLLMAHMYDILDQHFDPNDAEIQKDLETILRNIPSYIDIMIMLTIHLAN
mmetsp:Transcript_11126/g.18672  ORF Transcript_11126/g.18672 Transcript_11126/m.18672 type:complete len:131 (+) Transcript_11126:774-1166(+)